MKPAYGFASHDLSSLRVFLIMLEYLHIRDLALISDMELEFASGMNVLTGETGAGKSFILKALNFLMGERLGADMVRPGKERAQVEALFMRSGEELIVRRELIAETGRSRLFINDTLASQETIKELRTTLLVHTSQHGQQKLLQPNFQAKLIDDWMNQPDLLAARNTLLKELKEAAERKEALRTRFRELADRRELLEMHLTEIEKVSPAEGEEEQLEAMRAEWRGTEQLRRHYERAQMIQRGEETGLLEQIGHLERALELLAGDDEDMAAYLESAVSFRQTIAELERKLRRPPLPQADIDPEQIEARLFELAQLKRKLHRTLPEILALREEIQDNLSFLDACTLDIRQVEKREKQLQEQLAGVLALLNPERRKAGESFTRKLESELQGLGFSQYVRVSADWSEVALFPGCVEDRVRLLWSPNPGQQPQPLDKIASGGELSRFMLAVVSVQEHDEEATLIFDEVDAGVGGLTQALAKELARSKIPVNALACGVIDTEMNKQLNEAERAELAEDIPAGRFATPEEVAEMVWKLICAPEYLTGQIITFDGGYL